MDTTTSRRLLRARSLSASLIVAMALTACSVRLESEPTPEATPDASELARQAVLAETEQLERDLRAATALPAAADPAVSATLDGALAIVAEHRTALEPTADDTPPTGSPTTGGASGTPDLAGLVESLQQAADDTVAAASTADASLARLLTSIAAAQFGLALEFAPLAAVDPPVALGPIPESGPHWSEDWMTVAIAEDQTAYLLEVLAAGLADEPRNLALAQSQAHREMGERWVGSMSLTGTDDDPRSAIYPITTQPSSAEEATALAIDALGKLAAHYASKAAGTTDDRAPAAAGLRVAVADLGAWGQRVVAFPGLSEQSPAS